MLFDSVCLGDGADGTAKVEVVYDEVHHHCDLDWT